MTCISFWMIKFDVFNRTIKGYLGGDLNESKVTVLAQLMVRGHNR